MRSGPLIQALPPALTVAVLLFLTVAVSTGGESTGSYVPRVQPAGILPASVGPNSPHPFVGHVLPRLPFNASPAQGSGPWPDTNLTPNTPASSELAPAAAPAGTMNRVAFATNGADLDHDGRIDATLPPVANYNIWLMRPDGSECMQLTNLAGDEKDPAWDPGCRWIAFSYSTTPAKSDIYAINLNTLAVYQITSGPGRKVHPTYSPDGNWIAYATDENGNWDIYKKRSDATGAAIALANGPNDEMDPTFAPAGNLIAYTAVVGGRKRVFVMDSDGGGKTMLSTGGPGGAYDDQEPAWLRTGTAIAFASNRPTSATDTTVNFNIWQMPDVGETGGGTAVLLTDLNESSQADSINPCWSPELERVPVRLFFESNRANVATPNVQDIWAMFQTDNRPPELADTPWVSEPLPASQARGRKQYAPGDDVAIHVPVYDLDSGVASVRAILKDPDSRRYFLNPFGGHDSDWDTNYGSGQRYYEWDCAQVDSVELFDDGSFSNSDQVANDGVFSGVVPLSNTPRDYIIDIVVQDVAGNSFRYDSIAGFTTREFVATSNILFVDDYCQGQKFLYLSGYNNDFPAAWYTESYYRYNPSYHPGVTGTIDYDSIRGPYGESYDVWRIICRGRSPPQVYQYYLPTVEYQLDFDEALSNPETAQATRRVLVANRAVIWACPHAGDVWIGSDSGSLLDAATQSDLGLFLDRGGRLFLSGENIVWALTLNGTVQNEFVSRYLHCSFLSDTPVLTDYYVSWPAIGANHVMQRTGYGFNMGGPGGDPVAYDPWAQTGLVHGGAGYYDDDDRPLNLVTPRFDPNAPDYTDAAEFSLRPDTILPHVPSEKLYGIGGFSGPACGIRYSDEATGARVVFLSFGFEQIHRGYHSPSNLPPHCMNKRSHLIHNAMCWMRTGGFQGRVISISDGGRPISEPPYPIVYLYRQGDDTSRYAVRCQADGTWVAQGLPSGYYRIEATRPGYSIDHYDGAVCHGGLSLPVIDLAIKRADPGGIFGMVTSAATGDPLPNVLISVTPVPREITLPDGSTVVRDVPPGTSPSDWPKTARTAPDGSYAIGNLPPWDYEVTADGSDVGHGTGGPEPVTVTSNNTFRVDFELGAADGYVVAHVYDANTLLNLEGATVFVRSGLLTVRRGTTNNLGIARIATPPGDYTVVAEASGYGRSTAYPVTVVSGEDTPTVEIPMTEQPPGSVTGRIVSAATGDPVGGIEIVMTASGKPPVTVVSTSSFSRDRPDGPLYNWKFPSAPAGTVRITPQPTGFTSTPPYADVQVVSGEVTENVVFRLTSLRTFARGLQLMSLPGDYTAYDPASLFNIPPGGRLRLVAWEAPSQRYSVYPQAPADRIRVGVGYWLYLDAPTDLNRTGNPVLSPREVYLYGNTLTSTAEWNLVGDPFSVPIDIYGLQVRDGNGVVMDWQTARALNKIRSVLWAYVLGSYQASNIISPYIGYWVATNEPLWLIMSSSGTLAAPQTGASALAECWKGGWVMPLVVKAGDSQDASLYLGVAPGASDGFDPGRDQLKPPPPTMGPYVYAAAVPADADVGPLAVDLRRAPGGRYQVQVQTTAAGEPVTVTWPDLSAVPRDVKPYLIDPVANRRLYMRTTSSYTYTDQGGSRTLVVEMATDSGGALVVSALQALPRGGGAEVVYTLSRPAVVDVVVMNISGATVRRLASGLAQGAGLNRVSWDGRSDRGSPVPAGRYLVVVRAAGESGERTQGVAAVTLGR